jgi:predicted amidohydrolase YtcJ
MRSFEEIRQYVQEVASDTQLGELIFIPKVYSTRLKERRYPNRYELDEFSGDHLVMLDNGYASALNSAALKHAGISRRTANPDNGKIIRDPNNGEPNGLILGARQLLSKLLQSRTFTDEDRLWAFREMQKAYNAAGITSVFDGAQGADGIRLYQRFWEAKEITVRICVIYRIRAEDPIEKIREELLNTPVVSGFGDEFLKIGHLKFSLDGGILIGTAYLREPFGENTEVYGYSDPEYRGVLRIPQEKATEIVKLGNRLGWRLTAHVTGGGSMDVLMNAFEEADKEIPIKGRRFSMIHGNFPNQSILERAARLGVVLDMQPAWYHLDGPALSQVLGPERMKTFHPYRSVIDAGVIVAGGSDHVIKFDSRLAINPYHPFFGMWMVVTRKTSDGTVFNPEQRITREEALKMWTWNAAYNSFEENIKGSIEPGKLADLTVISKDYLTCPEDEIKDIEAVTTILGGKVVFQR